MVGACGELWLYDAVGAVQQRVRARFAATPGIRVLDDEEWRALAPASIDMVTVVSVAQYLKRDELESLFDAFRRVVRPDGEVVFADIIPPHVSMVADISSLLGTGWRNGFFIASCIGLARTFFSEYRRIRATAGFSTYEEADFRSLCTRHGFSVERLAHNVGFNQQRMTFRLRPVASSSS
jgi:SAM-dependent methyltransferase